MDVHVVPDAEGQITAVVATGGQQDQQARQGRPAPWVLWVFQA